MGLIASVHRLLLLMAVKDQAGRSREKVSDRELRTEIEEMFYGFE